MKLGYTTYENLGALEWAKSVGFQYLEFTTLPGHKGMDLPAELDSHGEPGRGVSGADSVAEADGNASRSGREPRR